MKKFKFSLDSVRGFRQARLEEEEARMQGLQAELEVFCARLSELDRQELETMERIRSVRVVDVDELIAADAFRQFAGRERERLRVGIEEVSVRLERQREVLTDAQRQVEVLKKLRERRLETWRAEVDREMENAVAELVIARWRGIGD